MRLLYMEKQALSGIEATLEMSNLKDEAVAGVLRKLQASKVIVGHTSIAINRNAFRW